jgi:hypothetical protein
MTYTELVDAIQEYTENYEATFVANIPVFVQQAETRIYNAVQIPALRKNVTGPMKANNKYLPCPGDFLSSYSLAVIEAYGTSNETYHYLLNKDVNYIREAYPTPADTGLPQYYALFGPATSSNVITDELAFIFGPTPDSAYTLELHYYYYPQSITVAPDGRTWLGDNYDPALLYGALREAYLFMKGETDLIQNVEAKYNEAMAELKRLGDGLERQDAYRSGQVRVPVT